MARLFEYEGLDKRGKRIKGRVYATSKEEALKKLREEGLLPYSVKERRSFELKIFGGVSEEELGFSLIQVATFLYSGFPLTKSLELVSRQVDNELLSSSLISVKEKVERGVSVSEAFSSVGVFPQFFCQMLRGSQRGENLELIFKSAGEFLLKLSEIRGRLTSSLIYPSVVITFSFLAIVLSTQLVIPKIEDVLKGFGKELPLITKLVVKLFTLLTLFALGLPFLLILLKFKYKNLWEKLGELSLKAPLIGKIILYFELARFCKVLNLMLSSANPIDLSLQYAISSLTNPYLKKRLWGVEGEVLRGKSLSRALKERGVLPEDFINLLETGEISGELERILELMEESYTKRALREVELWVRLVEPLSILLVGFVVALVVISVILPIVEISTGL